MKIVKFKDGKFGVRKTIFPFFLYEFLDAKKPKLFWVTPEFVIDYCKVNTKEEAEQMLSKYLEFLKTITVDNGTPI